MQIVVCEGIAGPKERWGKSSICYVWQASGVKWNCCCMDASYENALVVILTVGRHGLVIMTIDLGINTALEVAQDGLIKGIGAQLPYQQGLLKQYWQGGDTLLGK